MITRSSGEERRTTGEYFPRPSGEVFLWVSVDKWIQALALDTAPEELAVVVESQLLFEVGFQVRVAFKHTKRLAEVISVNELDDGRYRIGLKWVLVN